MTKQLSTNVVRLDLGVILANYNKPAFWKKKWVIYESKALKLVASIDTIDVKNNKIFMTIAPGATRYTDKKSGKETSIRYTTVNVLIPIGRDDYTKEKFQNDITNSCLRAINIIEAMLIMEYGEYQNAMKLTKAYRNKLKEIAEGFLDDNNVSNKDIRSAYIETFVDNSEIPDYSSNILNRYEYTVIPQEYLMCAAFTGAKDIYDVYAEKCKKLRKSTKINIWLKQQELNTEEFVETIRGELDAL